MHKYIVILVMAFALSATASDKTASKKVKKSKRQTMLEKLISRQLQVIKSSTTLARKRGSNSKNKPKVSNN